MTTKEKTQLTPDEIAERRRLHAERCRISRDKQRIHRARGGVVKPKKVQEYSEGLRNRREIERRILAVRKAKTMHASKHGTDKLPKEVLDEIIPNRRASRSPTR